jgi:hypothetical protein
VVAALDDQYPLDHALQQLRSAWEAHEVSGSFATLASFKTRWLRAGWDAIEELLYDSATT